MLKLKTLTPEVRHIVCDKATEAPFTGEYYAANASGTYLCRGCGLALYRAMAKFNSSCGWPSYDAEIAGTIKYQADTDGERTEILCARCAAHLGHVFIGEGYTVKNSRHCVNSAAIDFVNSTTILNSTEALFAGGCFWGMQYFFEQLAGVVKTEVGYSGGHALSPSYDTVCRGNSGHFEVTRVIIDTVLLNYENLAQYFFEIHDPSQVNGQGPDIGAPYLSAVFYYDAAQKKTVEKLIDQLSKKGITVTTQVKPVGVFWKAEPEHQAYYARTQQAPYCHRRVERFKSFL